MHIVFLQGHRFSLKEDILGINARYDNIVVLVTNRLNLVEECMVFGLPEKDDNNDVKIAVKVVYSNKEKTEDEIYKILWEQIKKINKTLPKYKYIQKLILTDEELVKTTTKKVKRNEEMKKILANIK